MLPITRTKTTITVVALMLLVSVPVLAAHDNAENAEEQTNASEADNAEHADDHEEQNDEDAQDSDEASDDEEEDTTPPSTNHSLSGTLGDADYYVSPVTVELTAEDDESGVEATYYTLDDGPVQAYEAPFEVADDGDHTLVYWSVDEAGNREENNTVSFQIDQAVPQISILLDGEQGEDGWFTSSVEVTIDASDATSGVDSVEYRLDDGDWLAYEGPFTVASDGFHELSVRVEDRAGNEATEETDVPIDTRVPLTTFAAEGTQGLDSWYRSPVDVTLSCADATSGCDQTYYTLDDQRERTYEAPFTIDEDGIHTVSFYSEDRAGNEEPAEQRTVKVDRSDPVVNMTTPQEGYVYANDLRIADSPTNHTVLLGEKTIRANASDAVSGVHEVLFAVDGELRNTSSQAPHAFTFNANEHRANVQSTRLTVTAMDLAGNTQTDALNVSTMPSTPAGLEATAEDRSPPNATLVETGEDADGDGVPSTIGVWNPLVHEYEHVSADTNDSREAAPDAVSVRVPENVTLGGDADADGIPDSITVETQTVTVPLDDPQNATIEDGEDVTVQVDRDVEAPGAPSAPDAPAAPQAPDAPSLPSAP